MVNKNNIRAKGWVFTVNNYTDDDESSLKSLVIDGAATYVTYGREVAPRTGTRHLQGCLQLANKASKRQVKILMGRRTHFEQRLGSIDQAVAYCQKDGDFVEHGTKPLSSTEKGQAGGKAEKDRWRSILTLAKQGDLARLERDFPRETIQLKPRLLSLHAPIRKPIDGELPHEWWVGETGTGKSRTAWDLYPTHYAKTLNKWWDGYNFEDVVIIEEWSPKNDCTASFLKIWADRYPFTAEVKGAMLPMIRPKKIIVLSNYTIDQCFLHKEDAEPMKRRFTTIEFPSGKLHALARVNNYEPALSDNAEIESVETHIEPSEQSLPLSPMFDFDYGTEGLDTIMEESLPRTSFNQGYEIWAPPI